MGQAGAQPGHDGLETGHTLVAYRIMLKYKFFSSRGTSRGTAFPAGARAPAGPGVAPPMRVLEVFIQLLGLKSAL